MRGTTEEIRRRRRRRLPSETDAISFEPMAPNAVVAGGVGREWGGAARISHRVSVSSGTRGGDEGKRRSMHLSRRATSPPRPGGDGRRRPMREVIAIGASSTVGADRRRGGGWGRDPERLLGAGERDMLLAEYGLLHKRRCSSLGRMAALERELAGMRAVAIANGVGVAIGVGVGVGGCGAPGVTDQSAHRRRGCKS
jgi:hypothetical protein